MTTSIIVAAPPKRANRPFSADLPIQRAIPPGPVTAPSGRRGADAISERSSAEKKAICTIHGFCYIPARQSVRGRESHGLDFP
jgi:hypothetical protein